MFLAKRLTLVQAWSLIHRSTRAPCAFNDRELADDIGLTRFESAICARRDRALG